MAKKEIGITPLDDRLVVRPARPDDKTAGGIIIPDIAKEKQSNGKVLVVGKNVDEIKDGNFIIFGKHAGMPIEIDGEDCLIMKESEVLAIIK